MYLLLTTMTVYITMSMAVKKAMVQGRARGEMPSMSRPTTTGMKASHTHDAKMNEAVAEASVSKP